jgi:hypothetical protein
VVLNLLAAPRFVFIFGIFESPSSIYLAALSPSWRLYIHLGGFTSILEALHPSWRLYLHLGGFTSILEALPPPWRLYLHLGDFTSTLEALPPPWRLYLHLGDFTSTDQAKYLSCHSFHLLYLFLASAEQRQFSSSGNPLVQQLYRYRFSLNG